MATTLAQIYTDATGASRPRDRTIELRANNPATESIEIVLRIEGDQGRLECRTPRTTIHPEARALDGIVKDRITELIQHRLAKPLLPRTIGEATGWDGDGGRLNPQVHTEVQQRYLHHVDDALAQVEAEIGTWLNGGAPNRTEAQLLQHYLERIGDLRGNGPTGPELRVDSDRDDGWRRIAGTRQSGRARAEPGVQR